MKKFIEKLKSDKKMQAAVICGSVGAVIILAAAITIPVTLHNRISVEKQAAQAAVSTESVTAEITTAAQATTELETTQSVESTTPAPTTSAADSNLGSSGSSGANSSQSSGSSKSTGSGSSSSSSGSGSSNSGSSSQKPASNNSGSGSSAGSVQSDEHQWTQAEVDMLVAEVKQYAISKGFGINSSMTTQGTSWNNPANTGWYTWAGDEAVAKVKQYLKEEVDFVYELVLQEFGYIPEGGYINIFVQPYTDSNGSSQWEIYVVR